MRDVDLYAAILGVKSPWRVSEVDLREEQGEVEVFVEHGSKEALRCPECDGKAKRHDTRKRSWRHLPTCQFKTILTADVPRVRCETHGTKTLGVPWSDPGSGFTALFEALVIDWLGEASIAGVARRLDLTWDQVDGVLQRAVRRGLARRELVPARRLGVDETSFQKRHEYVTLVGDLDRGVVHHVADGRGKEALRTYYKGLSDQARARIESVAMDMWAPYILATAASLDDAEAKICFDKFHVAMHLGGAVDRVRREENRTLREQGDNSLVGTRYVWLHHPDRMPQRYYPRFGALMKRALKTSRAWLLKELGMDALAAPDRDTAEELFGRWYSWAIRSRLEPMKRVARMVKRHLGGILNAIEHGVTNARLEGMNTVVQWLKRSARGFRSRERFRNAIYFHLGGLDLYPASFHSNS